MKKFKSENIENLGVHIDKKLKFSKYNSKYTFKAFSNLKYFIVGEIYVIGH